MRTLNYSPFTFKYVFMAFKFFFVAVIEYPVFKVYYVKKRALGTEKLASNFHRNHCFEYSN